MKALLLLLLPLSVGAQTAYLVKPACIPGVSTPGQTSVEPYIKWNSVGICVKWECLPAGYVPGATFSSVTYCGTWAEFPKVPGRIATIKKAADSLKSAQTAGNRFLIVPLTDPSMQGMPLP